MRCPTCTSDVADGRRFCPSCGTPLALTVGAAAGRGGATAPTGGRPDAPATADAAPPTARIEVPDSDPDASVTGFAGPPYPDEVGRTDGTGYADDARPGRAEGSGATAPTAVTPTPAGSRTERGGPSARDRLAPAGAAVRRRVRSLADRYTGAPADVRLALVGAVVTVVAFLALPYAVRLGTAAHLGGRLWWRPLTAVVATVLLATTLRPRADRTQDRARAGADGDWLLAAVVVATIGATEAGLVGIVSGATANARIGYYAMLAGLVTVLVACVRAARRRGGA